MQELTRVFPPHDFALLGVILALPLLGAFVNGVFGKRIGKEAVTLMALAAVGVSFIASVASFFMGKGSCGWWAETDETGKGGRIGLESPASI